MDAMSRLDEIKARVEEGTPHQPEGWEVDLVCRDRAFLLMEVDRLKERVEKLEAASLKCRDDVAAVMGNLRAWVEFWNLQDENRELSGIRLRESSEAALAALEARDE